MKSKMIPAEAGIWSVDAQIIDGEWIWPNYTGEQNILKWYADERKAIPERILKRMREEEARLYLEPLE